jgi:hypothetical protein
MEFFIRPTSREQFLAGTLVAQDFGSLRVPTLGPQPHLWVLIDASCVDWLLDLMRHPPDRQVRPPAAGGAWQTWVPVAEEHPLLARFVYKLHLPEWQRFEQLAVVLELADASDAERVEPALRNPAVLLSNGPEVKQRILAGEAVDPASVGIRLLIEYELDALSSAVNWLRRHRPR